MSSPIPQSLLHIQGDPTAWGLRDTPPQNPNWGSAPVALQIIGPLVGTLVLSPARIGSFALLPPPIGDGWVPTQKLVSPFLYIPSATGLPSTSPGYMLAPGTDLAVLQQHIESAMSAGTSLVIDVVSAGRPGVVVLNGAGLPFAVLGEAEGDL
jgi:hypothetical protein